ncbi:hypothetical protein [Pelagibius sp. Alg239-R121]|uniref:hypothetical protein n=1 Tax=Pelagibius sp. Alg239-R121 TaxID=2993448 RepID=UPI0024A63A51|nr:hypothetical protein [Pelagibius sp. Alg239-R121]
MPRDVENWPELHRFVTELEDIAPNAERALFYREENSHRGIARFSSLRKLKANMVNQAFFEEICELGNLEYLSIETVTAENLASLKKLHGLRVLQIDGLRRATDFHLLAELSGLTGLYVVNAKHLQSLDFLSNAHHLQRIGIEGSMWTKQKIDSLAPLRGLKALESLFMTSVQLTDKDLSYLAECPQLLELHCARFAPKANFERLRRLMPGLQCRWNDEYEI